MEKKIFITDPSSKYNGMILSISLAPAWHGSSVKVWHINGHIDDHIDGHIDWFWLDQLDDLEYIEITKENEDRFKKLIPFM